VSEKKTKQNYFCYNYVKLPPNLTIFDKKMANSLKFWFSTSSNSCQCTTVLNTDVPNCYINAVGLIISIRLLTFASSIW